MPVIYVLSDENHCEHVAQFPALAEAVAFLRERAKLPWNEPPNAAPCSSSATCGREYWIHEYDDSSDPWRNLRDWRALDISAKGVVWDQKFLKEMVSSSPDPG